ncbi:hypothetical protein RF638_04340 [Kocuria sp. CPCC 205235]|uniref:hypothetical protein n=1 Tax=Kocuria sp. CPCC 205235 TaxID=3073549 RepID=UPI0034D73F7E
MPETKTPNPVLAARGRLAIATRVGDTARAARARMDMRVALLERSVREAMAESPALPLEDRERVAAILVGGGSK